jgi:plastocyanin
VLALTVTIANFAYAPDPIIISVGTTVTWTNTDTTRHSATADDGSFDTDLLPTGESGSVTFNMARTFPYTCDIHPYMTGTVIVR